MPSTAAAWDKAALRREYRARRNALSAEERAAAATGIARQIRNHLRLTVPPHGAVAVYLAGEKEADLSAYIVGLLQEKVTVVAPRGNSFAVLENIQSTSRNERGTAEPGGEPFELLRAAVFFVPGLAFDVAGARLGQGGGWYDRVLQGKSPGALCIGVGFDEQLAHGLPCEAHDVLMDFIVTPTRWIDCRRSAGNRGGHEH